MNEHSNSNNHNKKKDLFPEQIFMGLMSGILLAIPFLAPLFFWLHYLALVPWLILITRYNGSTSWLAFFIGSYSFFAMVFGPFSALHNAVPFWIALFLAPLLLPFFFIVRTIHFKLSIPLVLLTPIAWVTTEWLRINLSVGQVALFSLGTSQYTLTPLIQVADITGIAGVSFLVAAANGVLVDIWQKYRMGWVLIWPLGTFFTLLLTTMLYGEYQQNNYSYNSGPRIAIVQPNEVHYRSPDKAKPLFKKQLEFTRREILPGSADLIAWPENAIDFIFTEDAYYQVGLQKLAQEQQAAILSGAFSWASKSKGTLHTSAYYLPRDENVIQRYDKLYLIPWAEYLPFEEWLPRFSPTLQRWHTTLTQALLGYIGPGVPGKELTLFSIKSEDKLYRFATPVCYEISNPSFAREAVIKGANFLINISSEGFFGAPVYYHMWAISSFRAIENRIAVVRVGNNGISGFIAPDGRQQNIVRGKSTGSPYLEPGALVDRVLISKNKESFYNRHGDLFSHFCIAVSLALLGVTFIVSLRARKSRASGISRRP